MKPPKGRTDKRTYLVNVTDQYRARHDPAQSQFEISPQTRLINEHTIERVLEVKLTKMKIPTAILERKAGSGSGGIFLKAPALQAQYGLSLGATIDFTMTGDLEASTEDPNDEKAIFNVPVHTTINGQKLEGRYSLNKTNLRILGTALGKEYDSWVGVRFKAFIGPTRNPQTQQQTTNFTILADSVKSAKSK